MDHEVVWLDISAANVLASAMVSQHREIRELQVGGILV
jgi:hypothetical protein